jgi:Sodium:solute symporter family
LSNVLCLLPGVCENLVSCNVALDYNLKPGELKFGEGQDPRLKADITPHIRSSRDSSQGGCRDKTAACSYYALPSFITSYAPAGVVGLIIAAIFAAAMSTISAELASLSTATVIDFYRRYLKPEATDAHYLKISKLATGSGGPVCLHRSFECHQTGLVDRGGQQVRLLFLWLVAGSLRAGDWDEARDRHRPSIGLIAGILVVALVGNYTRIVSSGSI